MTTEGDGPGAGKSLRHEVEGPKATDALYQAFPNVPAQVGFDPADGLPRAVITSTMKDAEQPPLVRELFVCMGDYSSFVMRDVWGTPHIQVPREKVERAPNGQWRARAKDIWAPEDPIFAGSCMDPDDWIEVQPIRPQCEHYRRQLMPFPEEPTMTLCIRLCTARRTDEGEFLDVGGQQMHGCELRSPPYGNEQQKIDDFDDRIIEGQKKRKEIEDDFDIDAALARDAGSQTTEGN